MPRGGRRPGAGAPKGNLNAVKNGLRSKRILRGMLMLALLPDVQIALRTLKRSSAPDYRRRFFDALLAAYEAVRSDPDLAQSIRDLVRRRFEIAARQIQVKETARENSPKRSDNQTP